MSRERWPSRTLFIFAAIGSAVGLGNLWRFPYLVGKYGGGAFLLPYIAMLFIIGFPLLILEFSIGQKFQRGAVDAFAKIGKGFSGIGVAALFGGFGISCYYAVVMGWALLYAIYSINLSWGEETKSFFYNDILQLSESANVIGGFSLPVLLALALSWVMVYFCLWKGIKGVSKVIQITMPLPVALLLILLGRTLFLPGAMDGLAFYLAPNFSAIFDVEVWIAAVAQVFFTLSLGFGVMICYASYQREDEDIVFCALVTSIADVLIALLAGFVIFTTIGHMAHETGQTIEELASSGPSLAFIIFPHALNMIPGAPFFAFIFFTAIITLGIDSLFSLVEAIATLIYDNFENSSSKAVIFYACLACFLGGLIFTTHAGLYYLDITDHFVTSYLLVICGLLQAVVVGWFYDIKDLRRYINEVSSLKIGPFWEVTIKYIVPLSLSTVVAITLYRDIQEPYGGYPQWALSFFGWGLIGTMATLSLSYSLFQLAQKKRDKREGDT